MITYSHLYTTAEKLDAFLLENQIPTNQPLLIRVHTTTHEAPEMPALLHILRSRLPLARIVGCSSPAIIWNGTRRTGACLISITDADTCGIATASLPCYENDAPVPGDVLAAQLCSTLGLADKQGQLVLFLPQGYFQCSRFAEAISRLAPGIRMIGGVANDAQESMQDSTIISNDYTFTEQHCGRGRLAAAVIASPELRCCEVFALGMDKLTDSGTITSYDGNIIHTINDRTPLEWLNELAGEHITSADSNIIQIFPIYRKGMEPCGFPVTFVKDAFPGSVMIVDDLEEHEEIGIGYLDTNRVVDEVIHMYRVLKKQPMETLFAYSCTLRSTLLQNCSQWELSPLSTVNACGAFLGGEFFHDGKRNYFGNCSVVLSALATSETYRRLNTSSLNDTHHLSHDNEHLVDFLIANARGLRGDKVVYDELYSRLYASEELQLGNSTKLFHDVQIHRMDKLCMLSVRNGSELVAYAGYKAYSSMIYAVVRKIQNFFRDQPVLYYMTEQGDVLLASNEEILPQEFEAMMRRLYDYLQIMEYSRMLPIFEFSLVLRTDKELLRSAKVAQSVMRTRKNQRFSIYSSEMGMEEDSVHDVQMAQVISDAISHGLVQPFYQGIYDNTEQRITMYESLMRLTDADGRTYYPNEFFPVARKYGLYGALSYQMIDKVMATFADKNVQVTMNLATQDIMDPKMTDMIYDYMRRSKYPEQYIFEVVESEDINDYDALGAFAENIHAFGGKLALDDFGSGFSNLIHVLRLDMDYLKVDGGIVKKICEDADCRQLLEMVSAFCKMRDKKVIAEFVENRDIYNLLCTYQVDYSQGYLFSRPEKLFC